MGAPRLSVISWREDRAPDLDLGDGYGLWWTSWSPDRALNPQFADLPDVERFAGYYEHPGADGYGLCSGSVTFDGDVARALDPDGKRHRWQVESWEPLTLSPSLLCRTCGSHGFIRGGQWVSA
jgi:hypothetical protein